MELPAESVILDDFPEGEALRYMGCPVPLEDPGLGALFGECRCRVLEAVSPRYCLSLFDLRQEEGGLRLAGTGFLLEGESIRRHLTGCPRAVLMAATVGSRVEGLIRRAQVSDMTRAVMLEACASAAVEELCDRVEGMLRRSAEKEGLSLTTRFSPGYGDMPLSQQKLFVTLLDTPRKIGLTATSAFILTPRKSVTAVLGLSPGRAEPPAPACRDCPLRDDCDLRKRGLFCGKAQPLERKETP